MLRSSIPAWWSDAITTPNLIRLNSDDVAGYKPIKTLSCESLTPSGLALAA
jgi:hypothetical protein